MKGIEQNYARTFSTVSGQAVISHMRQMTIERCLGPNATDAQIRWSEAQRAFVHQIENMILRGAKNE